MVFWLDIAKSRKLVDADCAKEIILVPCAPCKYCHLYFPTPVQKDQKKVERDHILYMSSGLRLLDTIA